MNPPRAHPGDHDRALQSTDRARSGGLYIHVPFCRSLCDYCHFARTADHDAELRKRVVEGILAEFAQRRERCRSLREGRWQLATVYVGGGTPSVLEPELLGRLLRGTAGQLPAVPGLEITVEANPEGLTPERAAAWRASGVERVSLGVQSLDDEVLAALGRSCDAATARRALHLACEVFPRVAADFLLGPGLRREGLLADLGEAIAAGVDHVSLYVLELHPGTPLAAAVRAGRRRLPPLEELERGYLAAAALLQEQGLHQYEVANFALPGRESRHNRNYWRRVPYLGLGPGAHGFWGRRRYANLADPAAYLVALGEGRLPEAQAELLEGEARTLERVILPLRTVEGVPLVRLPLPEAFLVQGETAGLWRRVEGRLRLTPRGFLRIDDLEERLARAFASRSQGEREGAG
jgi:oxygen-independent coproporphyrinogen-3 oxidase